MCDMASFFRETNWPLDGKLIAPDPSIWRGKQFTVGILQLTFVSHAFMDLASTIM